MGKTIKVDPELGLPKDIHSLRAKKRIKSKRKLIKQLRTVKFSERKGYQIEI